MLEKHFDDDFTPDQEKEITFKLWPPGVPKLKTYLVTERVNRAQCMVHFFVNRYALVYTVSHTSTSRVWLTHSEPSRPPIRANKINMTIVYSLISGPQTFSDFFYIMKVCEETVLCN